MVVGIYMAHLGLVVTGQAKIKVGRSASLGHPNWSDVDSLELSAG